MKIATPSPIDEILTQEAYQRVVFWLLQQYSGLQYRDAENIANEAILYVWRNRTKIDPSRGSVWSLLFTAAKWRALDHWNIRTSRPCVISTEIVSSF